MIMVCWAAVLLLGVYVGVFRTPLFGAVLAILTSELGGLVVNCPQGINLFFLQHTR